MARLVRAEAHCYANVYAALASAVEAEIGRCLLDVPGYWREVLAALRAGEPVDVPVWLLPKPARPPLPAGGPGLRAVVHPDDTITDMRAATAGEWLGDHGL